jgi:diguanylate cyclase (GGDEF)-like protein
MILSGTFEENDPESNQSIRLINQASLFVILITIPYIFLSFFMNLDYVFYFDLIAILIYTGIYYINSLSLLRISRILLLVQGNIHVLAISILLGKESGINHYFYTVLIAPFFFFKPREYKTILPFCIITILLGITYPMISEFYHPYSKFNDQIKLYFFIPSISGSYISILVFILYFYIETFQTQKILAERNLQLQFLGETDFLTQIGNRRKFEIALSNTWNGSNENPIFILLIDVDSFKKYNDLYGHLAGDDCLRKIANTLDQIIRNDFDSLARYGGEEFIVLLKNKTIEEAKTIASKMIDQVYLLNVFHQDNLAYNRVTISIGLACMIPEEAISPNVLIEKADQSLYEAKQTGKNKFIFRS